MILYNLINPYNEEGYYIKLDRELTVNEKNILEFLTECKLASLSKVKKYDKYVEIGPHTTFKSPWCSNALSILRRCGVEFEKIEKTVITTNTDTKFDEMVNMKYTPRTTLDKLSVTTEKPYPVPVFKLKHFNIINNLGFDEEDLCFYKRLFNHYGRSPTDVELYDLAQSNSEHSRHWFFNGQYIIRDEYEKNVEIVDKSLMKLIKETYKPVSNSLVYLNDNASVIKGFKVTTLSPENPLQYSQYSKKIVDYDIAFTAETHNFPTGVAPFPGAATGTGGRIRDNQAVGRGGIIVAGIVGYCVGNLNIPGYVLPWEDKVIGVKSVKSALEIEIQASNGASDYGNKIGEPVISGFTRSFGLELPNGRRIEWLKPIMFSSGIGMIERQHIKKHEPKLGMFIVRLGGPAYRIGMGGGAASSMCQNENVNLNAVQRGDPEMENRLNRVIRACIDLGKSNPILSIHDQGAGGMANVTKEIASPNGAIVDMSKIVTGDDTMSILEKWVCEYQEQITVLTDIKNVKILQKITERENCPFANVGYITNTGRIEVYNSSDKYYNIHENLKLNDILEDVPQKKFILLKGHKVNEPFYLPEDTIITFGQLLNKVLRLLSVGSKRFLTNKVDRSVTGLIAQQQCVGPFHTPLANVAVTVQSHYSTTGIASSIGEQPIKGLISPQAMARMSVGEMLTNIMWVKISDFDDIKCSGNWMWPDKVRDEGYHLYTAGKAFVEIIKKLDLGIDGGKDSLSMSVKHCGRRIDAPGSLVVSGYAPVPDITKKVTPDFKKDGNHIVYIDFSNDMYRMGGSALAQTFKQVGDESPDIDDSAKLKNVFKIVQHLIDNRLIFAGHDRSDGGLITTIIEMCISGNKGCDLNINCDANLVEFMFCEELGIILEVENVDKIRHHFEGYPIYHIGNVNRTNEIEIRYNDNIVMVESVDVFRSIWEDTSFHMEKIQIGERYATEEKVNMGFIPEHICTSKVSNTLNKFRKKISEFNVAILREEGSNGDKEMASVFEMVGFNVWDINMKDLSENPNLLDKFVGIAFVGGFSFSDVFGAANGWHASIQFNENIKNQFQRFYDRKDTFSLGVCNGCQLMSRLGWIPPCKFVQNNTKRFESRFSSVKISKNKSIMFEDMEDCVLGVWVAHGEGKCVEPKLNDSNICLNYVDNNNENTERYPFNPNGSVNGITGVCSDNGRHLAMMPHPERCFLKWQMPYIDDYLDDIDVKFSPWFMMFINAYEWCEKNCD